ncbi:oxygenase MpaB family protein [Mycobacterium syngnathidarum]
MSSIDIPLKDSAPTATVPGLPARLTLGTEAMSGVIDYLLPGARVEFIDIDPDVAQRYGNAIYQRDDVADALELANRRTNGAARQQFEVAVERGIEAVSDPLPEVTAFFETVDDVPPGIDIDLVERGAEVLRLIDPVTVTGTGWTIGFLLAAILPNTAEALVANERTINIPGTRAMETGDYVRKALAPGGYRRFGEGAKTAMRLRLLHSAIRLGLLARGWNEADFGTPASIADTIGGALPHSYWMMLSAERAGYSFTDDERRAVAEFAACALFRHGIPADLIPRTPAEFRLLTYISLRTASGFAAPEATARLMPPMAAIALPFLPRALQPAGASLMNAYGRRILGDPLCAATGIPDSRLRHLISVLNLLIGLEDRTRRRVGLVNMAHIAAMNYVWDNVLSKIYVIHGDSRDHLEHTVVKAG